MCSGLPCRRLKMKCCAKMEREARPVMTTTMRMPLKSSKIVLLSATTTRNLSIKRRQIRLAVSRGIRKEDLEVEEEEEAEVVVVGRVEVGASSRGGKRVAKADKCLLHMLDD